MSDDGREAQIRTRAVEVVQELDRISYRYSQMSRVEYDRVRQELIARTIIAERTTAFDEASRIDQAASNEIQRLVRARAIEEIARWHEGMAAHHCEYAAHYSDVDGDRSLAKAEVHERSAASIRATLSSQPASGWRDIASVPDLTEVWVGAAYKPQANAPRAWITRSEKLPSGWHPSLPGEPTHWYPAEPPAFHDPSWVLSYETECIHGSPACPEWRAAPYGEGWTS